MKRFIVRTTIFLGIVVGIINLVPPLVPMCNYLGNTFYYAKLQEALNPNRRFDTFIFGSSRMYRHIRPGLLDQQTDVTMRSYNLGAPGTASPETYYLVEEFIKMAPAQEGFILVELQAVRAISEENLRTIKTGYYLDFANYSFAVRSIWNHMEMDWRERGRMIQNYTISYVEQLLGIRSLRKCALLVSGFEQLDSLAFVHRGHLSLETQMEELSPGLARRQREFLEDTSVLDMRRREANMTYRAEELPPPNPVYLERMNGMIQAADEKGYHLIFVLPPRLREDDYRQLLPVAEELGGQHFIDLANPQRFKEFYRVPYSFDVGHLNSDGLRLFTALLAEGLNEITSSDE